MLLNGLGLLRIVGNQIKLCFGCCPTEQLLAIDLEKTKLACYGGPVIPRSITIAPRCQLPEEQFNGMPMEKEVTSD